MKKIFLVIVLVFTFIGSNIHKDTLTKKNNLIFEASSKSEADIKVKDLDVSGQYAVTSGDFTANYVPNTKFVMVEDGRETYGQGYYMTYNEDQSIVFCIDPLTTAWNVKNKSDLFSYYKTTFATFDQDVQTQINKIVAATGERYRTTHNDITLVAGQLLIWQETGAAVYPSTSELKIEMAEISKLVDSSTTLNYYDTIGQDLVGDSSLKLHPTNPNSDAKENNQTEEQSNLEEDSVGTMPTIQANSDAYVKLGDKVSLSDFDASAYDEEDGDITSNIELDASNVDTSISGIYTATLSVKDSDKNETSIACDVLVGNTELTTDGNKPVISSNSVSYLYQDGTLTSNEIVPEDFNAYGYDLEDGIISNVKLTSVVKDKEYFNSEEVLPLGTYKVGLKVTDKDGNTTNAQTDLIIGDEAKLDEPFIISNSADAPLGTTKNDLSAEAFGATIYDPIHGDLLENNSLKIDINTKLNSVGKYDVLITGKAYGKQLGNYEKLYIYDTKLVDTSNDYITASKFAETKAGLNVEDLSPTIFNAFALEKDANGLILGEYDVEIERVVDKDDNLVEVLTPGVYTVDLSANNKELNTTSTLIVTAEEDTVDESKPYIYAEDYVINTDDTLDSVVASDFNAFAFDKQDGILEVKTSTDITTIDTTTVGAYPITLYAEDLDGNISETTVNVVVIPAEATLDEEQPFIYAENVEVNLGDSSKNYEQADTYNAFAYDKQDGVVDVNVDKSTTEGIDTNIATDYFVSLDAVDSEGNESTTSVTYHINGSEPSLSANDGYAFVGTDLSTIDVASTFGASATNFDGDTDLTSSISADFSDVDSSKVGVYDVEVSVHDNVYPSIAKLQEKIAIVPTTAVIGDAPYVYGQDYITSVNSDSADINASSYDSFAYDKQDGVIESVDIESIPDLSKRGVYPTSLVARDTDGNIGNCDVNTVVLDKDEELNDAPLVFANDVVLNVGDTIDLSNPDIYDAKAYDKQDGVLPVNIDTDISTVDITKPGITSVSISSVDTDGNTGEMAVDVVVLPAGEILPTDSPFIYAENVTLDQFDTDFDSQVQSNNTYNAFAYDKQDGNITSQISISADDLLTDIPQHNGIYDVSFSIIDSDNNLIETTSEVSLEASVAKISDGNQLASIGSAKEYPLWRDYELVNDIDCTGIDFETIGKTSSESTFTGTFNGNYHVINNLKISEKGSDDTAMFKENSGVIKNIGFDAVDITGTNRTGTIAATNNGTIENVYVSGNVSGETVTGSIAGYNKGTISNTTSNAVVSGVSQSGGLVGNNQGGTLTDSYFAGTVATSLDGEAVSGSDNGGLVGVNDSSSTIDSSFFAGKMELYDDSKYDVIAAENTGAVNNSYAYEYASVSTDSGVSYTNVGDSTYSGNVVTSANLANLDDWFNLNLAWDDNWLIAKSDDNGVYMPILNNYAVVQKVYLDDTIKTNINYTTPNRTGAIQGTIDYSNFGSEEVYKTSLRRIDTDAEVGAAAQTIIIPQGEGQINFDLDLNSERSMYYTKAKLVITPQNTDFDFEVSYDSSEYGLSDSATAGELKLDRYDIDCGDENCGDRDSTSHLWLKFPTENDINVNDLQLSGSINSRYCRFDDCGTKTRSVIHNFDTNSFTVDTSAAADGSMYKVNSQIAHISGISGEARGWDLVNDLQIEVSFKADSWSSASTYKTSGTNLDANDNEHFSNPSTYASAKAKDMNLKFTKI